MDEAKFRAAYDESRNGANYFVRHPLVRKFQYSDGVEALAEAGCYWLLDIFATELPQALNASGEDIGYVDVTVKDSKAELRMRAIGHAADAWSRDIEWTDMPEGQYHFELVNEGERYALILISEH